MADVNLDYAFLKFLAEYGAPAESGEEVRLPSLSELSRTLGVSIASLREQLEAAKAIGLVDVRPRRGIRRLEYSFLPAVRQSLRYAVALDRKFFFTYADLRNHIEASYWEEAASKLLPGDHRYLQELLESAWSKLNDLPVQIPHDEHRQLHLVIYRRLDNPFVLGLLEAYWDLYESVGLNLYADYDYLKQVWSYHQLIVESILNGDYARGYEALVRHKDLLFHRPQPLSDQTLERARH